MSAERRNRTERGPDEGAADRTESEERGAVGGVTHRRKKAAPVDYNLEQQVMRMELENREREAALRDQYSELRELREDVRREADARAHHRRDAPVRQPQDALVRRTTDALVHRGRDTASFGVPGSMSTPFIDAAQDHDNPHSAEHGAGRSTSLPVATPLAGNIMGRTVGLNQTAPTRSLDQTLHQNLNPTQTTNRSPSIAGFEEFQAFLSWKQQQQDSLNSFLLGGQGQ